MANVDFSGHYKRFVQFFWDPEPRNDSGPVEPIWCLGEKYESVGDKGESLDARELPDSSAHALDHDAVILPDVLPSSSLGSCDPSGGSYLPSSSTEEHRGWPADFLDDFESRFFFTYRSHFSPIQKSGDPSASSSLTLAVRLRNQLVDQGGFTSDAGFGCMIRSGQCIVANAMAMLKLGRDWRRGAKMEEERKLLNVFADDPRAPFSLHRFIDHGASHCGKHPGEWFGPSATASCIEALSQQYPACGLSVYVTGDGADIYQDRLFKLARNSAGGFRPVLILIGIRLGIERVTPVYWDALTTSLKLRQSIGIAGGRPSASHYFVGVQGEDLFYLDPHQTRPMLPHHTNSNDLVAEDVASCHTRRLRRLHISKIDPSMLLAYLIRSEQDWFEWREAMSTEKATSILRVTDLEPSFSGDFQDEVGGVDGVEALDEEFQESDGELISLPMQSEHNGT